MAHVAVMATTASVGLMTLFLVDLADMFFLSLLGETELAAAVGFAASVLFFTTSIGIGIAIATGALVSRSIGKGDRDAAKRYTLNVFAFGSVISLVISAVLWVLVPDILILLGARDRALTLATSYLRIIVPSMVILVLAMSGSGALRAYGDPRRSMMATVWGGLLNAVLDPILIFGLDMGVDGAAWASVAGRLAVLVYAINGLVRAHGLTFQFKINYLLSDLPAISKIAVPAILTNIATPIGNAYVVVEMSRFGDSAVAGMSIIGRIIPVAFGMVFALSGAVGPIIGQNFGANRMDRVRSSIRDANLFSAFVVICASLILFLLQHWIISAFNSTPDAAALISLFCTWIGITFMFNGMLFISNAAFNNLGYPHYSTLNNFAKNTLGTIPFVYIGAQVAGAAGVLAGQALGSVVTGIVALWLSFHMVGKVSGDDGPLPGPGKKPFNLRIPIWPQTNTRG